MTLLKNYCILMIACILWLTGRSQTPDFTFMPNIGAPQLFKSGNQTSYPIMKLNSADQLEMDFDDLDGDVKNYYYTLQLCNADWTPAMISEFEYLKGFPQVRIGNYQYSSIALTRYTHYTAMIPDPNCIPVKSGNYLMKVFLDGDTSKLAFTRRMLVVNSRVNIQSQYLQPTNYAIAHTYQHIQFKLNTTAVNPMNPLDQIKVVVLQNYRWDNAAQNLKPTFYVNNNLEYNDDNICNFPAGKEWRWLDMQSFIYQSDRIKTAHYNKYSTDIFVKQDSDRATLPYTFYKDYNGAYFINTTESINPIYQTDYATVHFSFVPPGHVAYPDKDIYVLGQFTGGGLNDSSRMTFNAEKGRYERTFFLKQGYYSYLYVTVDRNDPNSLASFDFTEGNHAEAENEYMILVYYRPPGGRADELVGLSKFNSINK